MAAYLKISRARTTPNTGLPDGVGQFTMTATDMTVPFSGFTAEISRTYNSNDIYAAGPLGYGWRMNSLNLGIEKLPVDTSNEYEEAMIRLVDGREFFFANNPPSEEINNNNLYNAWASQGRYVCSPVGIKLHRPGACYMYKVGGGQTSVELLPGGIGRYTNPQYLAPNNKTYEAGEVAYLQVEDKTWYIFEWRTGDLLEIIHPDGQTIKFDKQTEANILVKDLTGRQVKMTRDLTSRRITSLTDPVGSQVRFEYDQYGNLSTVTDRSGRKRFYIYDTPEALKALPNRDDLTGMNLHYLIDVRVDDDSNGVASFDGDTIPTDADAKLQGTDTASQNWPGDISILEVSYEGGLMKGIETAGGSVSTEHNFNENDLGGNEVVRDDTTGAESIVVYDDQRRVTLQTDPYGNSTHYSYGTYSDIEGVLLGQTDALGQTTSFNYPDYSGVLESKYSSFSEMFEAYMESKFDSDLNQPGYLTGSQAQPSAITQCGSTTVIDYRLTNLDDPAVFQPTTITDNANNKTSLDYSSTHGKLTSVSFTGSDDTPGAQVENYYYGLSAAGDTFILTTDQIKNTPIVANSLCIGRLAKTVSHVTPQQSQPARHALQLRDGWLDRSAYRARRQRRADDQVGL